MAATCLLVIASHAATAVIDAAATQQVIRGFGGATAFLPTTPIAAGDLDTLFGSGPGQIGFTLHRIRIGTDSAWRAVELANAQGARARGAEVIASPWSPPAAMKDNNSLIAGSLKPAAYADYATYLNDFASYMAANGVPLYAISVQNEPDIVVTYESCDWTPAQLLDFCRNFAGAITATRVIAPESFQFRRALSDPILNDDLAAENIDIIGGHIYGAGLSAYPLAASKGKEVWMTEHLDLSTDWAGALATGKEIHDCLATANFSAYLWWYVRRYYGPLGEDGIVTKRGHVMAQFARFIRPGYVRVTAPNNPTPGVFVSAYKREKLVIVAVNQSSSPVSQVFTVQNATVTSVTPWTTSATLNAEAQPAVNVSAGSFTATLPAESVTTFVGNLVLAAPIVATPPRSHTVAEHSTAVFDVTAAADFATYQWSRNGTPLAGATDRLLTLTDVSLSNAGQYAVTITNSGGAVTSPTATLSVASNPTPSRLTNLSTRSFVGTGANLQITGFVIGGSGTKSLLLRAAGPTLASTFGISNALRDPTIEVRANNSPAILAANDDGTDAAATAAAALRTFAFSPGGKDAAMVVPLPPGAYTASVAGTSNGTGIALVEVYDTDSVPVSTLINLSVRAYVGTQDQPIVGFAIEGATARTVIVRVTGPTLHKRFGITGALASPMIELRRQGQPDVVEASGGWNGALASHFDRVSAFPWPSDSKDTALAVTLDPGAYTAIVRGQNGSTGVALIEVYAEP